MGQNLKNWFVEVTYTHENSVLLETAFQELVKRVGNEIVRRSGNNIQLRYPQVAYEERALEVIRKYQLVKV
ncbi:hypothetical protein IAQ67_14745 [Paenibacillus peoriae]|uniref:Uncharacterized protein n=1 Tax=Paenibacillus peoriae TaxID=59893 RepID=A0A7H0Y264_9BACL|nr:hypothetical protein [Paenibacillus peoriae]QNR65172.1 hypothetical protein IAQ67_14745 [Paenibacillus peoriae]